MARVTRESYTNHNLFDAGLLTRTEIIDPVWWRWQRPEAAAATENSWTIYARASTTQTLTSADIEAMSTEERLGPVGPAAAGLDLHPTPHRWRRPGVGVGGELCL